MAESDKRSMESRLLTKVVTMLGTTDPATTDRFAGHVLMDAQYVACAFSASLIEEQFELPPGCQQVELATPTARRMGRPTKHGAAVCTYGGENPEGKIRAVKFMVFWRYPATHAVHSNRVNPFKEVSSGGTSRPMGLLKTF